MASEIESTAGPALEQYPWMVPSEWTLTELAPSVSPEMDPLTKVLSPSVWEILRTPVTPDLLAGSVREHEAYLVS